MPALLLVSLQSGAGKTALAAGIAQRYQASGRRVGYMKPLTIGSTADAAADGDAVFLRRLLAVEETVGELCPVAVRLFEVIPLNLLELDDAEPLGLNVGSEDLVGAHDDRPPIVYRLDEGVAEALESRGISHEIGVRVHVP